ncbi:MAG: hypothetical protein EXR58_08865 [Chloroflexi bacterium]|nr:hypothetical protein [Chloroflexota bacterium]
MWSERRLARAFLVLALLVGLGLRVFGTGTLHLWGDAAYSVYAAERDWLTVATERLTDGHPPLFYYLQKLWMAFAGDGEAQARFASAIPGMLTIALTYRLGRITVGNRAATMGAWLVALSPYLVFYSRFPRMYEWLTMFGVLASLLALRLGQKPTWPRATIYGLAVTAGVYIHYFGALIPIALGPALWAYARRASPHDTERARRAALVLWLAASSGAALAVLPWTLYAWIPSRDATDRIVSSAPWPPGIPALLEQLWVVMWTGELLPSGMARLLVWPATGVVLACALGTLLLRRTARGDGASSRLAGEGWAVGRSRAPQELIRPGAGGTPTLPSPSTGEGFWGARFLLVFILVAVAICIPIFQAFPYLVRARFLIFLIPPLALLAAHLTGVAWRSWRPLGIVSGLAVLGATALALVQALQIEPQIIEPESVEVAQYLAEYAQPTDAAIFHAFWQEGYVSAHLGRRAPTMVPLRETGIDDLPRLFAEHRRVWLTMYQVVPWGAKSPVEEWLDRNAYRAEAQSFGQARVMLYVRPEEPGPTPMGTNFSGQIELAEAWVPSRTVAPGDLLGVGLRWRGLVAPSASYTAFIHLLDSQGRFRAGQDAEPLWGHAPTVDWPPGTEIVQRMAILVPRGTEPGDYIIEAGLYDSGDGRRLDVRGPVPADRVLLGAVRIGAQAADSYLEPATRSSQVIQNGQGRLEILGFTAPEDRWTFGGSRILETSIGPVQLTYAADPYGIEPARFTIYWRVIEASATRRTPRLRLVNSSGESLDVLESASPQEASSPTDWPVDSVVVQDFLVKNPSQLPSGTYILAVAPGRESSGTDEWTPIDRIRVDHR